MAEKKTKATKGAGKSKSTAAAKTPRDEGQQAEAPQEAEASDAPAQPEAVDAPQEAEAVEAPEQAEVSEAPQEEVQQADAPEAEAPQEEIQAEAEAPQEEVQQAGAPEEAAVEVPQEAEAVEAPEQAVSEAPQEQVQEAEAPEATQPAEVAEAPEAEASEAPQEAAPADVPQEASPEVSPETPQAAPPEGRRQRGARGGRGRDGGRGRGRGRDDRRGGLDEDGEELVEKLVHINRVSKTVKGGKRFGFAALVVVGDGKGRAGFGHGKAREVPEAISKATAAAKKAMVRVPLREGRTLHHDGMGHFGAGRVYVRSAPQGTGIIAGGPMRAVFESLGVADVVTKSVGTSNPYNMVRATFQALSEQTSPKSVAQRRGKKIADLMSRRDGAAAAEAAAEAEAVTE